MQLFNLVFYLDNIQQSKFSWHGPWYLKSFMLPFFAIFIIVVQVWLIFLDKK